MERTHEVLNQPPPLEGYSLYASDALLRKGIERKGGRASRRIIPRKLTCGGSPTGCAG